MRRLFQSPIRSFSVCFLLLSLLLLVFPVRSSATYVFNIDDYGAQAEENSLAAAQANAKALTAALVAANTTGPGSVVLLEQGSSYVSMPFGGSGHVGVRIVIDGTLRMCDLSACRDSWPSDGSYRPFLQWDDGVQNTLEGTGMIDGQGYIWWWLFLLGRLAHKRPTMVYMTGGENLVVANLTMRNSPIMHMHMDGVTGAEIRDLTIWVDWRRQLQLAAPPDVRKALGLESVPAESEHQRAWADEALRCADDAFATSFAGATSQRRRPRTEEVGEEDQAAWGATTLGTSPTGASQQQWGDGFLSSVEAAALQRWGAETMDARGGVPMLPFNTDGIDPGAGSKKVSLRRITVENFDDVVAVKPCNGDCAGQDRAKKQSAAAKMNDNDDDDEMRDLVCTEDILAEDFSIFLGVGLSVGSVHPHDPPNCIRNVVFRRASFAYPFKAIYVKTNSGEEGTGIVSNVSYSDMVIQKPILWPVYIGPQQQSEPDGTGDGWWPATQPRVTLEAIQLRNISSEGGDLPHPGVLRCNHSNPCRGFVLDAVTVESRWNAAASSSSSASTSSSSSSSSSPFFSKAASLVANFSYVCDYVVDGEVDATSAPFPGGGKNGTCSWNEA